jgi:hypothetical protein
MIAMAGRSAWLRGVRTSNLAPDPSLSFAAPMTP